VYQVETNKGISLPLVPTLSQMNPVHVFLSNSLKNFNIILYLCSDRPRYLFPSCYFFRTKYVFIPLKPPDHPNSIW